MNKQNLGLISSMAILLIVLSTLNGFSQTGSKNYYFEQKATLTGTLSELKYADLAGNWNTTYILKLAIPIKVISNSDNYETQVNVKEVQVGFDFDKVLNPKALINKKITVTGELYGQQTVHDRRPVLLLSSSIN